MDFSTICSAVKGIELANYDLVVGIANGGVVPASIIAYKIKCELKVVRISYRNDNNIPKNKKPIVLSKVNLSADIRSILLVDDVSVSGKTLEAAKGLFKGHKVSTLVLRGKADYVVFPHITDCLKWPWNL